jgi:uncharacterized membrane protein
MVGPSGIVRQSQEDHRDQVTPLHCIVAFFFDTTTLTLTVNIGAGFI